ncbi:hypothetical protein DO659_03130 [Salmonella enterica subsp. enterica serovar Minnesota]|nr:hypothetical protein [Salmonella enterica subsp. enterica serovar Minnesota]
MDYLKDLYHAHVLRVAHINNWFTVPRKEKRPDYRAWLRAETYLRLDILISNLQKTTPPGCQIPEGYDAVRLLVSLHSGLSIVQSHKLSFTESLHVLLPELDAIKISQWTLELPTCVRNQLFLCQDRKLLSLPRPYRDEWDHTLLARYPGIPKI